jgi:hypothetical protein
MRGHPFYKKNLPSHLSLALPSMSPKLNQQGLLKQNVHKLRPIYDTPARRVDGFMTFDDNSLISAKPQSTSTNIESTTLNRTDGKGDSCGVYNSIDAVEKLLSEEEIDEIMTLPTMTGFYFDRKTQSMKVSNTIRKNYKIDVNMSINELTKECQERENQLYER